MSGDFLGAFSRPVHADGIARSTGLEKALVVCHECREKLEERSIMV